MGSKLIFRGHEDHPEADTYSPKPLKPWFAVTRLIRYILREQCLAFAIASIGFTLLLSSPAPNPYNYGTILDNDPIFESTHLSRRPVYEHWVGFKNWNSGGKVPLGLKRKGLRIDPFLLI